MFTGKQNTKKIYAAVLLLLFTTAAAFGQTYSVPKKLPIERVVKREFREWYRAPSRIPGLIPQQFFPIGWSRDGKLAYYVEPVDEACGCYFAHLVIQDLKTDKVVWEFKYNQDDTYVDGNMTGPGNIRDLWRKNRKLFSEKLAEYGIVASHFAMLGKKFSALGRNYSARVATTTGRNPDWDLDLVKTVTISLSSPKLGSKTVYSADYSKEEYWFTLDAGLLGVLKSPYENRVVIVGMEVNRGWEGPPHTGNIRIVGADLTGGFGKK